MRPEHQEKTLPNNVSHLHYKEFQDMFFEQVSLTFFAIRFFLQKYFENRAPLTTPTTWPLKAPSPSFARLAG